jgi:hypothetical protein
MISLKHLPVIPKKVGLSIVRHGEERRSLDQFSFSGSFSLSGLSGL